MNYKICDPSDELEPRRTPKPALKAGYSAVPSVPEVSLVFDKPQTPKTIAGNDSARSLSIDRYDTYAAWKEKKFANKPIEKQPPVPATFNESHHSPKSPFPRDRIMGYQKPEENFKSPVVSQSNGSTTRTPSKGRHYSPTSQSHPNQYENEPNTRRQSPLEAKKYDNTPPRVANHKETDERNYYVERLAPEHLKPMYYNPPNFPVRNDLQVGVCPNYQIPPYFEQNRGYNFPYPGPQNYPPQNSENNETIKNLLQLVNSQNEQIKSLQIQVDRLLKMQEKGMKERMKCCCSFEKCNKDPSETATNPLKKQIPKNVQQESANPLEEINPETHPLVEGRKTIMEQKVSIGVMTSFELTVQNNPFLVESEEHKKYEEQWKGRNVHEADVLRKTQRSFARLPNAPLENITEDSESHLSSSRQLSNNFQSNPGGDKQKVEEMSCDRNILEAEEVSERRKFLEEQSRKYLYEIQEEMRKQKSPVVKEPVTAGRKSNCIKEVTALPSEDPKIKEIQRFPTSTRYDATNNFRNLNDNDVSHDNCEKSFTFDENELEVRERPLPSPEPSIHVDMQDYSSDEESDRVKKTSKVGWTFYNNVLGQVNEILQNSHVMVDDEENDENAVDLQDCKSRKMDTVKAATMEQLRKLGISWNDNENKEAANNKKVTFDSSFYPRLDYQGNVAHATSAVSETNTSMHMKALALKYLSDEQLADLAIQKQSGGALKQVLLSNLQGTNMSFATMRYLERYQLLPGRNANPQVEDPGKENMDAILNQQQPPKELPRLSANTPRRYPLVQTPRTSCPSKILDISTLKQQPKLL